MWKTTDFGMKSSQKVYEWQILPKITHQSCHQHITMCSCIKFQSICRTLDFDQICPRLNELQKSKQWNRNKHVAMYSCIKF